MIKVNKDVAGLIDQRLQQLDGTTTPAVQGEKEQAGALPELPPKQESSTGDTTLSFYASWLTEHPAPTVSAAQSEQIHDIRASFQDAIADVPLLDRHSDPGVLAQYIKRIQSGVAALAVLERGAEALGEDLFPPSYLRDLRNLWDGRIARLTSMPDKLAAMSAAPLSENRRLELEELIPELEHVQLEYLTFFSAISDTQPWEKSHPAKLLTLGDAFGNSVQLTLQPSDWTIQVHGQDGSVREAQTLSPEQRAAFVDVMDLALARERAYDHKAGVDWQQKEQPILDFCADFRAAHPDAGWREAFTEYAASHPDVSAGEFGPIFEHGPSEIAQAMVDGTLFDDAVALIESLRTS